MDTSQVAMLMARCKYAGQCMFLMLCIPHLRGSCVYVGKQSVVSIYNSTKQSVFTRNSLVIIIYNRSKANASYARAHSCSVYNEQGVVSFFMLASRHQNSCAGEYTHV